MFREKILEKIKTALTFLSISNEGVSISSPANDSFGDYSTNIALKLSKSKKKNQLKIGKNIAGAIDKGDLIEKIEVIKPGFINIWIKDDILLKNLQKIDENYGNNDLNKGQKIIHEFTDPNPFKEMHIGHLYSNTIGESLSRLQAALGADVRRVNYQGDVGMHVAKSIWGLQKRMKDENVTLANLEKKELTERIKFLGKSYSIGSTAYEEDKKAAEEMKNINYLVYASAQQVLVEKENWEPQVDYMQFVKGESIELSEVKKLYEHGRKWSLEYFETIYKRMGTKFDFYFFESIVGEYGIKIVKEFLEKGIFEKSDGAIVFPGKKFGLHTRVFINSLGLPTYEAKELGLAPTKFSKFPYDRSIIITGNEINEYFKVLLTALSKTNPELAKKTRHIGHGMVRLPEGKMSSRTGKVLTGKWLLDEVKKKSKVEVEKGAKVDAKDVDEVSERLTIAAIKYSFLKQGVGNDIAFDINESLSLQGNSGPYLEYTYARCKSVLGKISDKKNKINEKVGLNDEELSLLRHLSKYEEVVLDAAEYYAPSNICTYLYDLAQKYNLFYQKNPILKADNEDQKNLRIAITQATAHVLSHGLNLLGIKTVEKM